MTRTDFLLSTTHWNYVFLWVSKQTITIVKNVFPGINEMTKQEIHPIDIIPYYEVFLHLHYKSGIRACEQLFRVKYDGPKYTCSSIADQNENYSSKVKAYFEFSKQMRSIDEDIKTFLSERMGWKNQVERFGIILPFHINAFF